MTTPYYQDSMVTLYHGDCQEITPALGKTCVDVILTDPPFFMPAQHYAARVQWQRTWGDTSIMSAWWNVILDACVPTLRKSGYFLTFCNHESYAVFYPLLYKRFATLKSLIWDKKNIGLGHGWRNQHELIIAGRWDDAYWQDNGKAKPDVLYHKATRSKDRRHPVEKPTILLGDLISPTCPDGGVVFDPFAGSGTTLDAARALGKRSVGIEIEERYCEDIARRMSEQTLLTLEAR